MKEKLKKETLAELYCLRAGMSLISIESERLQNEERGMREVTYKLEDNTAEIMTYDSIVKNSKHSYKGAKKDYESAKREYDKKSYPSFLWYVITVVFAIADAFLYVQKTSQPEKAEMFNVLLIVSLAFTAYAFLSAFVKGLKVKPIKKRMREAKEMMSNSEIWIKESTQGIKTVEKENRGLKTRKSDFAITGRDMSMISVPMADSINTVLKDTFSSLLRLSYWKNLDLIIYLLKTDKVDSIREATIEVDKTFKNGRYGKQLENAHAYLLSNIGNDITVLESELNKIYEKLSTRLKSENSVLATKIIKKKKNYFAFSKDVSSYLERSSSSAALKEAFMRKIERNSVELYSDMNYILTYDSKF